LIESIVQFYDMILFLKQVFMSREEVYINYLWY